MIRYYQIIAPILIGVAAFDLSLFLLKKTKISNPAIASLVIAWMIMQTPGLYVKLLPYKKRKYSSAFVTGGTSGIGKAFIANLEKRGTKVTSISRTARKGLKFDLTNPLDVEGLIEEINIARPELLILNAGVGGFGLETFEEDKELIDLNLMANIQIFKDLDFSPDIIVISSVAADCAMPAMESYCASKAAISAFFATITPTYAGRILIVSPGPVATKFYETKLMQKNTIAIARTAFTQTPEAVAKSALKAVGVFSEIHVGVVSNLTKLATALIPRPIISLTVSMLYTVLEAFNKAR